MADDKKFGNNDFEDIYSSSEKDGYEDIYSDSEEEGRAVSSDKKGDDDFENFFTGRDDKSDNVEYENETPVPRHREINTSPEVKPYSYNYNRAANSRAKKVSDEHGFTDISSGRQPKEKKPHRHSAGKIIGIVILILLVLCAAFAAVTYHQAKKLLGEVNYSPLQENEYIDSSKLAHSDSVRNILLIGVDAREGESSDSTRSDTMMILSIDEKNKQLKLTSILRDTYVEIPGWKWNKINAAQSHGGRQLLVDTIEYNFKVDIDNYMLVNFDMFTTIIDELGGVDVEVTEKEANYINARYNMTQAEKDAFPGTTNAGVNHFSGMQALWYSRMRYLDSDFYRTQRQRKVISAIIDKAKSNPTALYSIAEKVMPMIETAFLVIFDFVYLFIATRPKNMNKSISRSCKRTLKMLKKDGKLPYSQHYTVDFLDDEYIETTENSVSHIKYGDVNKVIYSDDALYLFIDAQRATAILYSCLGEDKQKIIDFIKQKTKG